MVVTYPRIKPIFIKENGLYSGTEPAKYVGKVIREKYKYNFHFHQLRHTHATMLIENGAPMKDVQERLGHGNIRITMDTYVQNTPKMQETTVKIFEEFGKLNLVNL